MELALSSHTNPVSSYMYKSLRLGLRSTWNARICICSLIFGLTLGASLISILAFQLEKQSLLTPSKIQMKYLKPADSTKCKMGSPYLSIWKMDRMIFIFANT